MFTVAYTYGSRDVIDLTLVGQELKVARTLSFDTRYEAYNMLLKPTLEERASTFEIDDDAIFATVERAAKRGVIPPEVPMVRPVLAVAFESLQAWSEGFYSLPQSWSFGDFTLEQFRRVVDTIRAILYVWRRIAPVIPPAKGTDSEYWPYMVARRELIYAIKDTTGIVKRTVQRIVGLLTYGHCGVQRPDPALQPLIPIPENTFFRSSPLILGTASERNLTSLINLLQSERKRYAQLTQEKEAVMRSRIIRRLPVTITWWEGRVGERGKLPDIDLALVDASTQTLLLLELKWFIDPAEPRELDQRSQELEKGVKQCKQLLEAFRGNAHLITRITTAGITKIAAAVVSANWIWLSNVQDTEVPIINEQHLIEKLTRSENLNSLVVWLENRSYLPAEGVHFITQNETVEYAGFTLHWYGLEPLEKDSFLPL